MIDLTARLRAYPEIRSRFNCLSDQQLQSLLNGHERKAGWGWSAHIEFEGRDFFVKGIPITDLELNNPWQTRNLYDLPLCYHYGVGSAGFGAYREWVSQQKFSDFVVTGQCDHFPLLYHGRILPIEASETNTKELPESYFEYWGGRAQIRDYCLARSKATAEVVLILEHFPVTVKDWILENQMQLTQLREQMTRACHFFERNNIAHMDLHFKNIVFKDGLFAIVDNGLVIDADFSLDSEESKFLRNHYGYDLDQFYLSLAFEVFLRFQGLEETTKAKFSPEVVPLKQDDFGHFYPLLDNLDRSDIKEALGLDQHLVDCLSSQSARIKTMFDLFGQLKNDPEKQARYEPQRDRL